MHMMKVQPQHADGASASDQVPPELPRNGVVYPSPGRHDDLMLNMHLVFPHAKGTPGQWRRSARRGFWPDALKAMFGGRNGSNGHVDAGELAGSVGGADSSSIHELIAVQGEQTEATRQSLDSMDRKLNQLFEAVGNLEHTLNQSAHSGAFRGGGRSAARTSPARHQLNDAQNAVLKEIVDHNMELRRQINGIASAGEACNGTLDGTATQALQLQT